MACAGSVYLRFKGPAARSLYEASRRWPVAQFGGTENRLLALPSAGKRGNSRSHFKHLTFSFHPHCRLLQEGYISITEIPKAHKKMCSTIGIIFHKKQQSIYKINSSSHPVPFYFQPSCQHGVNSLHLTLYWIIGALSSIMSWARPIQYNQCI